MKFRALPPTDFANTTVKRKPHQWVDLSRMKSSFGSFSYDPTRAALPAIFNSMLPLFPQMAPEAYERVRSGVERSCRRGEVERVANLGVCDAISTGVTEQDLSGKEEVFSSVRFGAYDKINYTSPLIIVKDGRPFIPFFDFRQGGSRLSADAMDFVFAVNYHGIVEKDSYFEEAGLVIFQFPKVSGVRRMVPKWFGGTPRWTVAELEGMIRTTNALWSDIQLKRREAGESI